MHENLSIYPPETKHSKKTLNWGEIKISRRSLLQGCLALSLAIGVNRFSKLSEQAKYLLIYIAKFDRIEGAKIQRLVSRSKLSLEELELATDELIKHFLIYRQGTGNNQKLFLYPLSDLFINNNLLAN